MTESIINITQDWPSSQAPEGYRLNMELQGATYVELQELADWLEAHSWFDEATAIREHPFPTHGSPEECNTCGGTGEWETTTEDSPDELVSLGPCPDCYSANNLLTA